MMKFVATIGRNEPCPCGSGKKYKRCCFHKDQAKRAPILRPLERPPSTADPEPTEFDMVRWVPVTDDPLDLLSNSVLQLIREQRFDEALDVCKRLRDEYPEVSDGFDREALVRAAMGQHELAAHFLRLTIEFITDPARRVDYDEESIDDYRLQLEEQLRLAASR